MARTARTAKRLALATSGLAALCALAAPAAAQLPGASHSAQLDRCLGEVVYNEHSSRWPGTLMCYEDELSTQDLRLQQAYQALETAAGRLGPAAVDQVTASRRQWALYRNDWCAFEKDYAVAPSRELAGLSCRIDVTKAQLGRVTELVAAVR